MSLDLNNINVLNYNQNPIFVDDTNRNSYKFAASRDGIRPSINTLTINEVKAIYNNSELFQTGWLTFEDEYKEAVFTELRVNDWKDILSNSDIVEILTHPTTDGLQKIIDIKEVTYFDRVRIELLKLIQDDAPIIAKVKDIVDVRHRELQDRKRNSEITIKEKDIPVVIDDAKAKELEAQNIALQSQLDAQKEQMEKQTALMEELMKKLASIENNASTATSSATKKPVGRPPKNKQ